MKNRFRLIIISICLTVVYNTSFAQGSDTLKYRFLKPPASARPRVWWHWTKSNVSKDGITKDLEWMSKVGIAGFQLADVNAGSGQNTDTKIIFGSPEWLSAVHFAATEAERLRLEMAVFSSAGWSLTGGTWVKPSQSMKKLVWSEMNVIGGQAFKGILPHPPTTIGPIRNWGNSNGYYADFAVIAFPTPPDELTMADNQPTISASSAADSFAPLLDDDLNSSVKIKTASGKPGTAWVLYTFNKPFKAKAITIAARKGIPFGRILASEDGVNYKTLVVLPGKQGYRAGGVRTFAFPETSAKYFKLEMTSAAYTPGEVIAQTETKPDSVYELCEMKLFSGGRVNRYEEKAGFNQLFEYSNTETPTVGKNAIINPDDIIILTGKMEADGTLRWNIPPGNYTIMRFGYSQTGAKNRPAVPAALGWEADKLSKQHMEAYINGYTQPLKEELGKLYGTRLNYVMMDSWEAGIQNWTENMPLEFLQRRGYDLNLYLPALTGRIVKSAEVSDQVLWDFRRTLVDLIAENTYGIVTNYLNKQGIAVYGEAGGVSLESTEDALLNKKYVNIPMGEFWVKDLHPSSMYYMDVRGAASAGHVYGKNIIAAESFTGGNYESPYTLKKISDYWFTQGINRLVFHTSAHQPLDTKPGNVMVGTHINRNITWAEQAKPFIDYVSRNSYMLQKGLYVADVAYLLNEGAPSTMPFWGAGIQPALPDGYQYDFINADALISRMSVNAAGKLVMPDGMTYSVLVLPQANELSLSTLKKVKELAANGATILGPRPTKSPGYSGKDQTDEITQLADDVWGDLDGISRTQRTVGKGYVYWGIPLKDVLKSASVKPDVEFDKPLDSDLSWIHRRDGGNDIYFVANRTDKPIDIEARFRVSGKEAELWHADDGSVSPASYTINGNKTIVPLHLDEREAVFVTFNKTATETTRQVTIYPYELVKYIGGKWDVSFPPKMGAPAKIEMLKLQSWTMSADTGIKYFSGTAAYKTFFSISERVYTLRQKVILDLGKVGDVAEVYVNGHEAGTLWKPPYKIDITSYIRSGNYNQLEVRVTNEWTNRLIGDQRAPEGKKILDSYTPPFGGQYRLTESGLMGPVGLWIEKK
ncbi:hypothetical protein BEL04_03015 [Mucilaginibacter sp. PPCGB 2223]|uniref:glycosyl hydrolase n=1 Tax=Mucilaginibacter sp. PPCGB 2223 TaxID=1886027 RepID=UPI0008250ED9|nr:glycosyl hydrolase [Mucilaginibacter sp. PPCGB 2223]OCX53292.1 hypothetical protein BEL04_03015 [Mucilaginibacter sp. PPCGB 2223]